MDTNSTNEEGKVFRLDRELLDRKETGLPEYRNKRNGLGIKNSMLKNFVYINDKRWPLTHKLYRFFVKYSAWIKEGGLKAKIFKAGIKLAPDMKRHTGTVVMPLNVDIADSSEKAVVPIDIIKKSLKSVSFIAGMDKCLCRDANDCKSFPHDLGCLFLGETAKIVVKHNLARQFTYEEACARVDEAARLGLMGQAVWVEIEQMLWGIPNYLMDHMLEICFCCSCCCIALKIARNATEKERFRFHPAGWTAIADHTMCVGCHACINGQNGCPVEALSIREDGKIDINRETCVGCGICKSRCMHGAISIGQTMPVRNNIQEYFSKEFNLDLKL